jgi:hypothetical protein
MFSLKICDESPKKAKEKEPMQISINEVRKAALVCVNNRALLKAFTSTPARLFVKLPDQFFMSLGVSFRRNSTFDTIPSFK